MQGRLAIGAACVGGMKRCLQLWSGSPSGDRFRPADCSTIRCCSTARVMERRAGKARVARDAHGDAARRGDDVPLDVYVVCKMAGSEWFWRAADDLVQFLGGRGYIETNIAAQLLRDARVTRILEGPTEALGMFLGSRVINDGAPLKLLAETLGAPEVSPSSRRR